MSVNMKVTGGLHIEWGQIDPKATGGLNRRLESFSYSYFGAKTILNVNNPFWCLNYLLFVC